jgi:tetratricopeptide (TPR) repeat protein
MSSSKLLLPALLMLAAVAAAQMSNPPSRPQPSGPPVGAQTQGTTPPGAQNSNQQPAPPPQPSNTNPKGKTPPSAKTKEEYDRYLAAANESNPAAAEKLAREFEVQFPKSDLLPILYQQVMVKYQKADNGDKTLDMGRKVLQYDPDNPIALVINATVLAERTRESDIDRDSRLKEATTDAQRALEDIRTGNFMLSSNATPEQVQQFKDQVSGMAYTALGTAELTRNNDVAAEQNFRKATETPAGRADAIVWYRLALALDHQKKYADANSAITTAVALAPASSPVATMAKNEQNRLKQLTAAGGAPPVPASNQPQPEVVQPK